MKWAYADPPYPGQAKRHYSHDPNAREVNHRLLVGYMEAHFDGWALSTSSPALFEVMGACAAAMGGDPFRDGRVRVASWVKPFAAFKPGVRLAYSWEPIILKGWAKGTREDPTVRDWVAANITMQRGLSGAKPDAFCVWLFEALGMRPGDEFEDVFPGSGAVSVAWGKWAGRLRVGLSQGDFFGAADVARESGSER